MAGAPAVSVAAPLVITPIAAAAGGDTGPWRQAVRQVRAPGGAAYGARAEDEFVRDGRRPGGEGLAGAELAAVAVDVDADRHGR